jgi:hypothetical protein
LVVAPENRNSGGTLNVSQVSLFPGIQSIHRNVSIMISAQQPEVKSLSVHCVDATKASYV